MKRNNATKKRIAKPNKTAPRPGPGSRSLLKLITGGVILSTATLVISLFAYFQPLILNHMNQTGQQDTEPALAEATPAGAGSQSPDGNLSAGTSSEGALSDGPESVPYLVSSQELGDISSLTMEDSYEQEVCVYSVMLDTAMGPMLYYNQSDIRWADYLYGGEDPMKKYGCGPTAVSMLVKSFSPTTFGATPMDLADWAAANGQYAPHGGSYHSLIPNALSAHGLETASVKERTSENAAGLLGTGHILVALMGKGSLTQNGHFILITKLLDNGNVHIADPNSYENSTKEWSLEQLMSELKESYDSGGPLWAVSYPAGGN